MSNTITLDPGAFGEALGPAALPPGTDGATLAGTRIGRLFVTVHGSLAEVETDWRAFAETADCGVFQTFGWLDAWQRTIGALRGTEPVIVRASDAAGQLAFILPLAIDRRGPLRRLVWLGAELCDYTGPLLATDFPALCPAGTFPELWRALVEVLRVGAGLRFDSIELRKMPETIGGQPNPFLELAVTPHASGAYVATLAESWDAFYAEKRSAATRKRERRQFKQLAEHGEVRLVTAEGEPAIETTLAALIAQKSGWFAHMGVENLFARPGYRAFYKAVATDPAMAGTIHVSHLDVGDTIAAANVGLTFRGRYYLILSSYAAGELSQFGTGRFHLQELMRYAIERGFRWFDFTVGDEPYKHDWCDIELKLYDCIMAASVRGSFAKAGITAYLRLKRTIKQNPVLWERFSRARAAAAPWMTRARNLIDRPASK